MKNVIYKLTSPSGKSYIGLTTNYTRRMKKHSKAIGNRKLQCAIRKYGFDNFIKKILIEVKDPRWLTKCEIAAIKLYDTFNAGYNMTLGGDGLIGYKFTNEHKRKLSDASKNWTEEHKRKISEANKGHVCSEKTKIKISDSLKGKIFTEEHKKNMSKVHTGKRHSKGTKTKISIALKGRTPWNKGKKNCYSEETKIKMSIAHKGVINER